MSNTPKIMVFRLKELIYTAIFILLAILLILFLVKMFNSDKKGHDNTDVTVSIEASKSEVTIEKTSDKETANKETTNEETTVPIENLNNNDTETAPPKKTPQKNYSPGVYTSSLVLNNSALEVQVSVDLDRINSISIKNMDEAITTMYPLMSGSIKDLENQIIASQSLENITYSSENRYTYMVLLDAINSALSKAEQSN